MSTPAPDRADRAPFATGTFETMLADVYGAHATEAADIALPLLVALPLLASRPWGGKTCMDARSDRLIDRVAKSRFLGAGMFLGTAFGWRDPANRPRPDPAPLAANGRNPSPDELGKPRRNDTRRTKLAADITAPFRGTIIAIRASYEAPPAFYGSSKA